MYRIEILPTDCDGLKQYMPLESLAPTCCPRRVCRVHIHSIPSHLCIACFFFGHQPVYHLANGVRIKIKKRHLGRKITWVFRIPRRHMIVKEMGRAAGGVLESRRGAAIYANKSFQFFQSSSAHFPHCDVHILTSPRMNVQYPLGRKKDCGAARVGNAPRPSSVYCILSYIVQSTLI